MMNVFEYFEVYHTNVFITWREKTRKSCHTDILVDILLFRDFNQKLDVQKKDN